MSARELADISRSSRWGRCLCEWPEGTGRRANELEAGQPRCGEFFRMCFQALIRIVCCLTHVSMLSHQYWIFESDDVIFSRFPWSIQIGSGGPMFKLHDPDAAGRLQQEREEYLRAHPTEVCAREHRKQGNGWEPDAVGLSVMTRLLS